MLNTLIICTSHPLTVTLPIPKPGSSRMVHINGDTISFSLLKLNIVHYHLPRSVSLLDLIDLDLIR